MWKNQCDGNGVPIIVTSLIKQLFKKAKHEEGPFWLQEKDLPASSMNSYRLFVKEIESNDYPNQMTFNTYSADVMWVAFVGFFVKLQVKPFLLDTSNALRSLRKCLNLSQQNERFHKQYGKWG